MKTKELFKELAEGGDGKGQQDRLSPFDHEYEAAKEVLYEAVCRRRGANRLGFVEPKLKVI